MSEQVTEDKGVEEKKSVVMPLAAGGVLAYGTKKLYDGGANKLALDATLSHVPADAKVVPDKIFQETQKIIGNGDAGTIKHQLDGAATLKNANVTGATITKAVGEGAKGYDIAFTTEAHGPVSIKVDKLTGEAKKLLGDKAAHTLAEAELAQLTQGAEKSWVAKTAGQVEQAAAKSIRGNEAYKAAGGGIRATFSHMGGAGKAGLIAGSVLATVGLVTGVKRMFSSHTERAAAPSTGTAPTR